MRILALFHNLNSVFKICKMPRQEKRPRQSSSSSTATGSTDSFSQHPVCRPPWPKREDRKIASGVVWAGTPKQEVARDTCVFRDIQEEWDEYDTLFYNAWLGVKIIPTRFADSAVLQKMGIFEEVVQILESIGMGTMPFQQYDLYPDLVRQFLSTVRVYYANELAKRAQEGTMTFLIRGVRYRISLMELCGIYGFSDHPTGVLLPSQWTHMRTFWSKFGNGVYDSKTSTQTEVRHPVLRYILRLFGNTILCKSAPSKTRVSELILLYYGLYEMLDDSIPVDSMVRANLGAVFAEHLVSLKTKPFTSPGEKTESVGSLLTPIFHHFQIDVTPCSLRSDRSLMDDQYLRHVTWMKIGVVWTFTTTSGEYVGIKLPQRALTTIQGDPRQLFFMPAQTLLRPLTLRPARAATAGASASTAAAADAGPSTRQSGSSTAFRRPPRPQTPMDMAAFQEYVIDSFEGLWDAVATLSNCGCVRPHYTTEPCEDED